VWLETLFTPERYQFQNKTIFCDIFLAQYLKGTAKAPAVDLLRLNTLRFTKTAFLTPKRYDEHHCPFYMGVLPPPGGGGV